MDKILSTERADKEIFQGEVDRLLGTQDIQFRMEIWNPGTISGPLPDCSVTIPGLGTYDTICINGDRSFPYLDVRLAWTDDNKIRFCVHRKPGELVKYLNTDSHHHRTHKKAVLSGVELRLALLTTRTPENENLCLSDLYCNSHLALQIAGQLKEGQKMRTLGAVLDDETMNGPA